MRHKVDNKRYVKATLIIQTFHVNLKCQDQYQLSQRDQAKQPTGDDDLLLRANSQVSSSTVNADPSIAAGDEDFGPLYSDDLPQPYSPSPPPRRRSDLVEVSSDEVA